MKFWEAWKYLSDNNGIGMFKNASGNTMNRVGICIYITSLVSDIEDDSWSLYSEEVDFATAYKAFTKKTETDIKSVVSGCVYHYHSDMFTSIMDREIDGKWIIING